MLTYAQIANAFATDDTYPVDALLAANQTTLDDLARDDYDLATLLAAAAIAHANTKRDLNSKALGNHRELLREILSDIKTYLEQKA